MDGVDFVVAQHVDPTAPVGKIGISGGAVYGGVDSWFAQIKGVGGHGAAPHKTVDPFYLTAQVTMALNAIVSRKLDPLKPAVVSIGSLHGGEAENVIPESVRLTGTLRFTETETRTRIHDEIRRAFAIARVLGGDFELRFETGGPPMANDVGAATLIADVAGIMLGSPNVRPLEPSLGAEDFGSFLERAPGAMFTLGTRIPDREVYHLHHPNFDVDERALPIGTALLVETALRFLRDGRSLAKGTST